MKLLITEEQYKIYLSHLNEAMDFDAWFAGSKVVDDYGNPLLVYHGTNKDFRRFNLKNSRQPIIWFSVDRDKIERGDAGAAGRTRIISAYLSIKKMAGWDEYEKYGLGQLWEMGYDGAKLDDDYFVFNSKQIKIVNQNVKKEVSEDVGEKYAEKAFNIKPEFSDFENRFQKYQVDKNKEEIIYNDGELVIIKNPKTLKHIGPSVRGIIDRDGNLYTEQESKCIHDKLLNILSSKGLLEYEDGEYWEPELPEEFITVQRYNNTSEYEVGESHYPMRLPDERTNTHIRWADIENYEDAKPIFQYFIDKANRKNPHIKFINEITKLRYPI